jgi:hypothetical protein
LREGESEVERDGGFGRGERKVSENAEKKRKNNP